MPDLEIKHPRPEHTADSGKGVPGLFIAAGIADHAINYVHGYIRKQPPGQSSDIHGKTLSCCCNRGASRKCWQIQFGGGRLAIEPGEYELTVEGFEQFGGPNVASRSVRFEIKAPEYTVGILYPSGPLLPGEEDYLVAYGNHTHTIASALIEYSDGSATVNADYIYDDLSINFWSAQFPPIDRNGKLEVRDSYDHTDTEDVILS